VQASDCGGSAPGISWQELARALHPLQLQALLVGRSPARDSCAALADLQRSLIDEAAGAGVKAAWHSCDADGCEMDRQLSAVAGASSEHDVVLVVPWAVYRNGLRIMCSSQGCLKPVVGEMFSYSEDASRCGGAVRALSLLPAEASCQDLVAGTQVGGFILNPSPALAADQLLLLPSQAFRTALHTIFADHA
jgi:hypothetical protein